MIRAALPRNRGRVALIKFHEYKTFLPALVSRVARRKTKKMTINRIALNLLSRMKSQPECSKLLSVARINTATVCASVLMFTTSIASAQQLPAAPTASVISVTPELGYFTEPAIAVNTKNPQQVVAVFSRQCSRCVLE